MLYRGTITRLDMKCEKGVTPTCAIVGESTCFISRSGCPEFAFVIVVVLHIGEKEEHVSNLYD